MSRLKYTYPFFLVVQNKKELQSEFKTDARQLMIGRFQSWQFLEMWTTGNDRFVRF